MPLRRATLPPTPGPRTTPGGETDPPPPQREPGDGDSPREDLGHPSPDRPGDGNGDDSPSSSGNGGNRGDGNSSEGSGHGHSNQDRGGDDDDDNDEPRYSDLGAGSTPSSQRGDASTEDQTSQAEELPAKSTGKTGTPATQPPAKGASKRKGKKPCRKFPGILLDKAQNTGPCLRKGIR